ncbi:hypothetical protein OXX79_012164, partial [Metschnikowia pulcherrima]
MNVNHKFPSSSLGVPSQQVLLQQLQQGHQHQQQQPQQPQQQQDGFNGDPAFFQRAGPGLNFFPQQQYQQPQNHPQQQQQQQQQQQPVLGQYQTQNALHSQLPRLNQPKFMTQQGAIAPQPSQALQMGAGSFPSPNKVNAVNVDEPSSVYWQHQVQLCSLSRTEDSPHYYARLYAQNSRKTKNPYAEAKSVTLIDATKTIVAALEEQEKQQQAAQTYATPAALMRNKKTDLEEDEEQRTTARTQGKQL